MKFKQLKVHHIKVGSHKIPEHALRDSKGDLKLRDTGLYRFNPTKILSAYKLRLADVTPRDGGQSVLGGKQTQQHRIGGLKFASEICDFTKEFSGYVQTHGGTAGLFDTAARQVNMFDEIREMKQLYPHVPLSALIRQDVLISMQAQPYDVVLEFIRRYYEAGIDVFTLFDALADLKNYEKVVRAVHEVGGHLQLVYPMTTYNPDPSVHNVIAARDFFKQGVKHFAPHSLYLKCSVGQVLPSRAEMFVEVIKGAFPELPLGTHFQNQNDLAIEANLRAVKAGANFIEGVATPLAHGPGHASLLSLYIALKDEGYNLGDINVDALRAMDDYYSEILPQYSLGREPLNLKANPESHLRSFAGGQYSIAQQELRGMMREDLMHEIIDWMEYLRVGGGAICKVTRAADDYFREAMRIVVATANMKFSSDEERFDHMKQVALSNFSKGFREILTGECGFTKEPVDKLKERRALIEKAIEKYVTLQLKNYSTLKAIKPEDITKVIAAIDELSTLRKAPKYQLETKEVEKKLEQLELGLKKFPELVAIVKAVDAVAKIARLPLLELRKHEVSGRIQQLNEIVKRYPKEHEYLNRKIMEAGAVGVNGPITSVKDRLEELLIELSWIDRQQKESACYNLDNGLGRVNKDKYKEFLQGKLVPEFEEYLRKEVPELFENGDDLKALKLLGSSGKLVDAPSDYLEPAMEKARKAVKAIDDKYILGMCDDERTWNECAIIWQFYEASPIVKIEEFFLKYYTGQPRKPLHDNDLQPKNPYDVKYQLRTFIPKYIDDSFKKVNPDISKDLIALQNEINNFNLRIANQGTAFWGNKLEDKLKDRIKLLEARQQELTNSAFKQLRCNPEEFDDFIVAMETVVSGFKMQPTIPAILPEKSRGELYIERIKQNMRFESYKG